MCNYQFVSLTNLLVVIVAKCIHVVVPPFLKWTIVATYFFSSQCSTQ